jgi:hypothetical protein
MNDLDMERFFFHYLGRSDEITRILLMKMDTAEAEAGKEIGG